MIYLLRMGETDRYRLSQADGTLKKVLSRLRPLSQSL
jgi:hypothetical protein